MKNPESNEELLLQLRNGLDRRVAVSSSYVFGDLLWDSDSVFADPQQLGGSVCVERPGSLRCVYLMIVRGEIRFWLTTNKDPYGSGAESGMGVLASVNAAILLCDEFIVRDFAIRELSNPPRKTFKDPF